MHTEDGNWHSPQSCPLPALKTKYQESKYEKQHHQNTWSENYDFDAGLIFLRKYFDSNKRAIAVRVPPYPLARTNPFLVARPKNSFRQFTPISVQYEVSTWELNLTKDASRARTASAGEENTMETRSNGNRIMILNLGQPGSERCFKS